MSYLNDVDVADVLAAALKRREFARRFAALANAPIARGRAYVERRPLLMATLTRECRTADLSVAFRHNKHTFLRLLVAVGINRGLHDWEATEYRLEAEDKLSWPDIDHTAIVFVGARARASVVPDVRYFDAVVTLEQLLPLARPAEAALFGAAAEQETYRIERELRRQKTAAAMSNEPEPDSFKRGRRRRWRPLRWHGHS